MHKGPYKEMANARRERMVKALIDSGGLTAYELARETGLNNGTTRGFLANHRQRGVYIDRYKMSQYGNWIPVYMAVQIPEDWPHPEKSPQPFAPRTR